MPKISVGTKRIESKLVIFDMDGTLIEEEARFLSLAKARVQAFRKHVGEDIIELWSRASGVDIDKDKIDISGPLARAPRREDLILAATVLYISDYRWDEAKELAEQVYNSADEIHSSIYSASLFPGVEDALRRMKGKGLKLAIATNDRHGAAVETMKTIGVLDLFDAILGEDDVKNPKPSPDMVLLACKICQIPPSEAIFVGDQPVDMEAGKKAEVKAVIAVRSKFVSHPMMKKISDAVVNSVSDIQVL